jgi:succinyl-CoA synthetase beta subunit
MMKLYQLFVSKDIVLLEINPLTEGADGKIYCTLIYKFVLFFLIDSLSCYAGMDCKINVDDNAEFRQKTIFKEKDLPQSDRRDVKAEASNLNYIGLDGEIGCLGE